MQIDVVVQVDGTIAQEYTSRDDNASAAGFGAGRDRRLEGLARVGDPISHGTVVSYDEVTVRDIAMTFILDRLGVQMDDEDEIPSVVVYVVSGGALTTHAGKILDGLKDLIHANFQGPESDHWGDTIADLVARESAIMEEVNKQQMADALQGDSPDYFTLWESRNCPLLLS